jgi:hypothetical protein
MPDALETSLTRVLHQAAEQTPEPGPGVAAALLRAHRRRSQHQATNRGRLLAVAAAVAVLIVLAGAVVAVRGLLGGQTAPPATPPTAAVHTDYRNGARVADVWPDAVRRVPSVLPGDQGNPLIQRTLPGGRLLVMVDSSPTTGVVGTASLSSWDPDSGDLRQVNPNFELVDLVAQPANASGEKWIVWAGHDVASDAVFLWVAPAAGGKWRKISQLEFATARKGQSLAKDYRLLISDDTVLVDAPPGATGSTAAKGITSISIASGRATVVTKSPYRVLEWPWLNSADGKTIWNVETDEKRTARDHGWKNVVCSVSWCTGTLDGALMSSRRDGSDVRRLADRLTGMQSIVNDRFVVIMTTRPGGRLYDLVAGKYLTSPAPTSESVNWGDAAPEGTDGSTPWLRWTAEVKGKQDVYQLVELGEMH